MLNALLKAIRAGSAFPLRSDTVAWLKLTAFGIFAHTRKSLVGLEILEERKEAWKYIDVLI